MKIFGIPINLRVNVYETPWSDDKRFGFRWSGKISSSCPFNYWQKNKFCKTGFRVYYGSSRKHLNISWATDLGWCPNDPGACMR